MTIRILQAWNGYPQQAVVSMSASEETRLVGLGIASFDLDGPAENVRMAQLATDAGGNIIGMQQAGGNLRTLSSLAFLSTSTAPLRVCIVGDSISEIFDQTASPASIVDQGGGIARVQFGAAFSIGTFWPGDEIKIVGASTENLNSMSTVITEVDTVSRLWFEYALTPTLTHSTTGSSPTIYLKYSRTPASYIVSAFALAGMEFNVAVDAAIGGGDSSQVQGVLFRDFTQADIAIYAPGMNDVYARGWTYNQIIANDKTTIDWLMSRVKILVIVGIPPRASSNGAWTTGKFQIQQNVNGWRKAYAESIGVEYIDPATAYFGTSSYIDTLSSNIDPFTAGSLLTSSDGVHPAPQRGGITFGKLLGGVLTKTYKTNCWASYLPSNAYLDLAENLIPNPLMRRTTGGVTSGTATYQNLAGSAGGEVADGWEIVCSGGASVTIKAGVLPRGEVVNGDTLGNSQRIVITNASGSNATVLFRCSSFHASMINNDLIDLGACVDATNGNTPGSGDPVGLTSISVAGVCQQVTSLNKWMYAFSSSASAGHIPKCRISPVIRNLKTRPTTSAGNFSAAYLNVSLIIAAGGSACIDVGRAMFKRKPG